MTDSLPTEGGIRGVTEPGQDHDLEARREALLDQFAASPHVAEVYRLYQRVSAWAPPPVLVDASPVRYSTGGNG